MAKVAKKDKTDDAERLVIEHMIRGHARAEHARLQELKEKLHVYIAHFGGHIMVFVAPSHRSVIDYMMEMGYNSGFGPIDLGERVWELPDGGYELDQVTLICSGDRHIEEDTKKLREAQKNEVAGI